ncbi:hypothetical protein GLOTRDRAFT_109242 [Gloeophyllum trabeum ATCC 11539]|uniref:DnaJ homolog 1, mitochondrial n=1 Tax=Gloeophyllum trabeum (strain ATCC 11539 / FP-39264 / Madison 617) TaxID=670483 RepID=S7S4Y6_GLOTA|nr:uncharacterized protein GLOTRDRAFT_109242 [Gloeophyllum trabeum ATCC 11539]EPQ60979.1 hypothetical protein GLOTRDRAFT_109242 [Gloeophyllum trabeum ATCC 11539]
MPGRLPPQGSLSFIGSYASSRQQCLKASRAICARRTLVNSSWRCTSSPVAGPSSNRLGKKRNFHASAPNLASQKDPYAVLGVKKDATQAEIKKVYFSLARKYHPDTNPDKDAQAKFLEIQEAYDILKDEKKRAAYDKYGAAAQQPGFDPDAYERARNSFGGSFGGGFRGFEDLGAAFGARGGQGSADLFEQLFGAFGGGPRRGPVRGEDLETTIGISFSEACKGTKRTITITPVVECATCSGSGLKAGYKRTRCTVCNGTGTRTFTIESGFQMASTCMACGGTGSTVPRGSQCDDCSGMGKVRARKTVPVDIPAGVEDGMTIRVPNAGDAPASGKGQPGDLLIRVHVAPSKQFRRQGANLYHEARIPVHTALLGGRVRVPTLDGEVDVRVPGGTQQGEEMVLKGRGVQRVFGGDKGDLFVTFSVQLPRSLTKRQREILQQYADDVEGRPPSTSGAASQDSAPRATTSDPPSGGEQKSSTSHDNDAPAKEAGSEADDTSEVGERKRATA